MKRQTIGLITYDHPHLKTEQVLLGLLGRRLPYAYRIYALPFVERRQRAVLFPHRPAQECAVAPATLGRAHGIPYVRCDSDQDIDAACDLYLVLGAGILSGDCVRGKQILNAHPGIIPAVRGLDAFKWAIYDSQPLGVTLHCIDEQVDAGQIVSILPTPVYQEDTLATIARRHYENEIWALIHFDVLLENPVCPSPRLAEREPKRRMPPPMEKELESRFEIYKRKFVAAYHER